jgi:hypothetical protein
MIEETEFSCSYCGYIGKFPYIKPDYCPNCSANMNIQNLESAKGDMSEDAEAQIAGRSFRAETA